MIDINKKINFAWRIMVRAKKDGDSRVYVYRSEGWMYILFCLLFCRSLPSLRIISSSFTQKIKEIEDKKDSKRFIVGGSTFIFIDTGLH